MSHLDELRKRMHEILGQQEDDIAVQRYQLVKAIEGCEDFKDCKTEFDVFSRIMELQGESALRECLSGMLRLLNHFHQLTPDEWLTRLIGAVKNKDRVVFDRITEEYQLCSLFGPDALEVEDECD